MLTIHQKDICSTARDLKTVLLPVTNLLPADEVTIQPTAGRQTVGRTAASRDLVCWCMGGGVIGIRILRNTIVFVVVCF